MDRNFAFFCFLLIDKCFAPVLNIVTIVYFYHSRVKLYRTVGMILSMPCHNVNKVRIISHGYCQILTDG